VPKALEALVMECLAKKADGRPQTAWDVLARLEACTELGAWSNADARGWWRLFDSGRESLRVSARNADSSSAFAQTEIAHSDKQSA
jgi:hypothetical protein